MVRTTPELYGNLETLAPGVWAFRQSEPLASLENQGAYLYWDEVDQACCDPGASAFVPG